MVAFDSALPLDTTTPESVRGALAARDDLWSGSEVVGIGWTARTVHELHVVATGLIDLLVDQLGFEAVLIEGDRAASEELDAYVRDGVGDPHTTLAQGRNFLANQETLDLVRRLRQCNVRANATRVRIVHGGADDMSSPAALERSLADEVVAWRERFGDRIIYLGGAYHLGVAHQRILGADGGEPVPSAGSLLRDRFGEGYCSVGLTFGSGAIPHRVPPPDQVLVEAHLDGLRDPTTLIPLRELRPGSEWSGGSSRIRIVGPNYDPDEDVKHSIAAPETLFDVLIHQKHGSAVSPLR